MVSVVHSVAAQSDFDQFFAVLADGLPPEEATALKEVVAYAWEVYGDSVLGSGERVAATSTRSVRCVLKWAGQSTSRARR